MLSNQRQRFALRIGRKVDACYHRLAANAEGDASLDERVSRGEYLVVAVNVERAGGRRQQTTVLARNAEFVEGAVAAIARKQQFALRCSAIETR